MIPTHETSSFGAVAPTAAGDPLGQGAAAGFAVPTAPTAASIPRRAERVEWPTVALAAGIYAVWAGAMLAAGSGAVPPVVWVPVVAWCVAWQASLQHEVIHGHPTPSVSFNRWIAGPPLALWLSYDRYRATHLQHHVDERLTDPLDDPESFYVTERDWQAAGPVGRLVLWSLNTLVGRLVLGPPWTVVRFALSEARAVWRGDPTRRRDWIRHGVATALVAIVIDLGFGVPLWLYALAVVWPATSLMLLRSFAEHRLAADPAHRSAIVESSGPLAWLFLSNNLHALHHERPGLPWFVLPKIYRANRETVLERNGGYRLSGYAEVARRWLVTPRDHPRHPGRAS